MTKRIRELRKQLRERERYLRLLEWKQSLAVSPAGIPTEQLADAERLREEIARLRNEIRRRRPTEILRRAIKLLCGPVADALYGECWVDDAVTLLAATSAHHPDAPQRKAIWNAAPRLWRLSEDLRLFLRAYRRVPFHLMRLPIAKLAQALAQELITLFPDGYAHLPGLTLLLSARTNTLTCSTEEDSDETA